MRHRGLVSGFLLCLGVAVPWVGAPVGASQHDLCAIESGAPSGWDAGEQWLSANLVAWPTTCEGEMFDDQVVNANDDDHDWFYADVPPESPVSSVMVRVCSRFAVVAPWETGISLFFLPASFAVPTFSETPGPLKGNVGTMDPGLAFGGSAGAGCDEVSGTAVGASLGRWYVHVERVSGSGSYLLTVE